MFSDGSGPPAPPGMPRAPHGPTPHQVIPARPTPQRQFEDAHADGGSSSVEGWKRGPSWRGALPSPAGDPTCPHLPVAALKWSSRPVCITRFHNYYQ